MSSKIKIRVNKHDINKRDVVGITITNQGSIYTTLQQGFDENYNYDTMHSIQFQLQPQSIFWECPPINLDDKQRSTQFCLQNNHNFYLHCPLQLNLARNDAVGKKMFNIVQQHCDYLQDMPASSILHIGNSKQGGTINDVANNINDLNIKHSQYNCNPYSLLLENCAGQGNDLGCSWEEFRHLYEKLDRTVIGLCFDTQHLFASGLCEFNNHWQVEKMWEQIDSLIGKPSLIHLNDSKVEFNGRKDRHETLGQGFIWNTHNTDSLIRLYDLCQDNNVNMILETPGHNRQLDWTFLNKCKSSS